MSIKARVKPQIPVLLQGEGGIIITQANGRATIGFDYDTSELGAELAQAVSASAASALDAETAQTGAEAAQTITEGFRDEAETAQTAAETAQTAAAGFRDAAEGFADAAEGFADAARASTSAVASARESFVYDMNGYALRGVPWAAGEPGGVVSYLLSAAYPAGTFTLVFTGANVPVQLQLLVFHGDDGQYYSAAVSGVAGNTITLAAALPVAVAAGANCWNFYINESHPNEYGYRVIADELIRKELVAEREVTRGLLPTGVTATISESASDNAFNPGSATAPAYSVTPSAAFGGCSWTFKILKGGQYRVRMRVNTAGAADINLRIFLNGTSIYNWTLPQSADGCPHEHSFEISDPGSIEVRLFSLTTNPFITSYVTIMEPTGATLSRLDAGRHVLFGDSWFAVASDLGAGDFGIIDRFRERFPKATWINEGVGGNTAILLMGRFELDVTPNNPDFVHIMCSTNDIYGGVTTTEFANWIGRVRSSALAIGAVPILYTGYAGAPTTSPARFRLSRQYQSEVPYWPRTLVEATSVAVKRHSICTYVPAGATVSLLSIGLRAAAFGVKERFLSHDCVMREAGTHPATASLATVTAGYATTPVTVTPSASNFIQLTHNNATGSAYTVSGYLDVEDAAT